MDASCFPCYHRAARSRGLDCYCGSVVRRITANTRSTVACYSSSTNHRKDADGSAQLSFMYGNMPSWEPGMTVIRTSDCTDCRVGVLMAPLALRDIPRNLQRHYQISCENASPCVCEWCSFGTYSVIAAGKHQEHCFLVSSALSASIPTCALIPNEEAENRCLMCDPEHNRTALR